MNTKIRLLMAIAIAHLPSNSMRCALYRCMPGYTIGQRARIGLGTLISVDRFEAADDVTIWRSTTIIGPIHVTLGAGTFIGRHNRIECGESVAGDHVTHMGYARRFITGARALINDSHLFDVMGSVQIGDGTWVAGFGSQFLTHGAGTVNRDIVIGSGSFIGSAARFAPGSGIGDNVIVAMGAVVTRRVEQNSVVVGGVPARVLRERGDEDRYRFERNWD